MDEYIHEDGGIPGIQPRPQQVRSLGGISGGALDVGVELGRRAHALETKTENLQAEPVHEVVWLPSSCSRCWKRVQVAPALYEEFFGRVQLPGVEKMCTHPGEKEKDRLEGLEKGLTRLGFRECPGADNSGPDGSSCAPAWQPEG